MSQSPSTMSHAAALADAVLRPCRERGGLGGALRRTARLAAMGIGGALIVLGVALAPLPGPLGVPVSLLGLVLVLKSSYWAKRQFIRAQYAKPRAVYPFRRLMRKNPEVAPVFWQQALRAERLVLKRAHRVLARSRKASRRYIRKTFR